MAENDVAAWAWWDALTAAQRARLMAVKRYNFPHGDWLTPMYEAYLKECKDG